MWVTASCTAESKWLRVGRGGHSSLPVASLLWRSAGWLHGAATWLHQVGALSRACGSSPKASWVSGVAVKLRVGALSRACVRLEGWVAGATTWLPQMDALSRARVCFPKVRKGYAMTT